MKRIWEPNDNCISERILSERYTQAKEQGRVFFHKKYCLFHHRNVTAFDAGVLSTRGFRNVWEDASPKLLPNLEFEHQLNIETDIK